MPLNLYQSIAASGSVPADWVPNRQGSQKYPVYNRKVLGQLRLLLPGKWQKVIKTGRRGEVHYFEHSSGHVAGVKFFES